MPSDPTAPGPARLAELYGDADPPVPVSYERLREQAEAALDPDVEAYVAAGGGGGDTVRENRAAFSRRRLLPRVLRDVSERDRSVELFGRRLSAPIMVAPIGGQSLFHPEGELATARAAASADVPMVLSMVASRSMEAVADALGSTPRILQLHWFPSPEVLESLVGRAEDAGYDAVAVTIDEPVSPWRERNLERGYFPAGEFELANFATDPVASNRMAADPDDDPDAPWALFRELREGGNMTWGDLDDLVAMTDLPVVLKGITHPDDAREAAARGAEGVVVSNHGGRALGGGLATLDALPDVADAAGDDLAVLMDGGVRRGTDVLKAIALGADAVLVGRPHVYGLTLAGEAGVRSVLLNLLAEFDLGLGQVGAASVDELGPELIRTR